MPLNIDWGNNIIEITSPTTEVTAQALHDFIEDQMHSPEGLSVDDIIKPEGKIEDPSNPGVYSQIIMILNSPWQIQFWAGSGYTRIYGGKIVGGLNDEPMKATGNANDITVLESPVDGVTVVSGSGITQQDKQDIAALVWDQLISSHQNTGTFGADLATTADLDAAVSGGKIYTVDSAGDITVTLGIIESGTYLDTQTHDESYLEISETVTGTDVQFRFTADSGEEIPRLIQFQGRYQGSVNHEVKLQAYNYETSTYEYLSATEGSNLLESSTTDYFKEFALNRNHIDSGTGNVLIKIVHGSPGLTLHRLWIDKINIVTSLLTPTLTEDGISNAVWSNQEVLKLLTKSFWMALK